MTIQYAILGLLAQKPLSGYDIKKTMQEVPYLYWSGNNNQIYKPLLQLLGQKAVTYETWHREGSPSKKIYSITDEGREMLRQWLLETSPQLPSLKHAFLIQLAFSAPLSTEERNNLLNRYAQEVELQKLMLEEKKRRSFSATELSQDEVLWELGYDYLIQSLEKDLQWVEYVKKRLECTT